ncbi:MAG: hypothetical protein P4M02_11910 [Clostridia bacterium]|nr:hypothetical protein [Clostridia bacterium]
MKTIPPLSRSPRSGQKAASEAACFARQAAAFAAACRGSSDRITEERRRIKEKPPFIELRKRGEIKATVAKPLHLRRRFLKKLGSAGII